MFLIIFSPVYRVPIDFTTKRLNSSRETRRRVAWVYFISTRNIFIFTSFIVETEEHSRLTLLKVHVISLEMGNFEGHLGNGTMCVHCKSKLVNRFSIRCKDARAHLCACLTLIEPGGSRSGQRARVSPLNNASFCSANATRPRT